MILFLLVLCFDSYAGVKFLAPKDRYQKEKIIKDEVKDKKSGVKKGSNNSDLRRLREENKKIADLLKKFQRGPKFTSNTIDETVRYDFLTGTVFRGVLLNSILSTNLESPIKIKINAGQGIKEDATAECLGTTKHKRVTSLCTLITIESEKEEIEFRAIILEPDGSAGMRPDIAYDGKNLYIASLLANSFNAGFLDASRERVVRDGVEVVKQSMSNKILGGLVGSLGEANEFVTDALKSQSKEPKLFINAGKEVLIYLKRRLKI